MAQELLSPLATKPAALEVSSDRVTEDVRVDVGELWVRILDIRQLAGALGNVVDLAQGKLSVALRQKYESNLTIADQILEVEQ